MRKILNRVVAFVFTCLTALYVNPIGVKAAETVSATTSDESKFKVLIGIAVLCVITGLVTLKRILYEKKHN